MKDQANDYKASKKSAPVTGTTKRHELVLGDNTTFNTYHVSYINHPKEIDITDNK